MQGQKLEQLLKSSDQISQILDFLKDKIQNRSKSNNNLNQDSLEYFEKAINLKLAFRFLTDGIQTNRNLVQVQKQKIERSKVFLEGLQYYKATLKNHIGQSKLDLVSVKDYIDEQPSQSTDWALDYKKQEGKILETLELIKSNQALFEQKQLTKQELHKKIQTSQDKYKKTFPQQIKKLSAPVIQTSKLFNIKQLDIFDSKTFKNRHLEQIHSLLYSLKLQGIIELKHINQFDTEEIEITVQKGFSNLYEYARNNKIMIEQKPFKFYIASIVKNPQFQKSQILALSVSRRQEFTTQQIFNNMVLNEKVKPIYANPKSETERNINNKYSHLEWLTTILASPSSLINGTQFINKIKDKMFNLYLTRYAVDNISKKIPNYFFPLFKQTERCFNLKSLPLIENKKIIFSKFERTTFEDYRKEVHIPDWVHKALNNSQLLRQKQKYLSLSLDQALEEYQNIDRRQLDMFIQKHNLDDLEETGVYSYFKFELLVEKSVLKGYLLLPNDYPKKKSTFKLLSFNEAPEKQKVSLPQEISLNFEISEDDLRSTHFSEKLSQIESQLNQEISVFLQDSDSSSNSKDINAKKTKLKQPFWVFFQINRLMSLMVENQKESN